MTCVLVGSSGRNSGRPGKFLDFGVMFPSLTVLIRKRRGEVLEKLRLLLGLEVVSILVAIFL